MARSTPDCAGRIGEVEILPGGKCRGQHGHPASRIRTHGRRAGSWVKNWKGTGGDDYQLSAVNGELKAIDLGHGIY